MLGNVLTAMVTPFSEDGSVDFDSFQRLARHLVENGSDGVVVSGTTGESPNLTDDERIDLFRAAIEAVGDDATVVAGTGTYSTAHSVHLTEQAHELGVDSFLVVTPYYNKPPQRGIVAHFEEIARVSDKPIVVYNIAAQVKDFRSGDAERARELDRELDPAYELLKVQSNPIPIKAALNLLGHGVGGHRLPIPPPTEDEIAAVRGCLERLGLLV